MDYRRRLFQYPSPYDLEGSAPLFLEAVRANAAFHRANCPEYARICARAGFDPASLRTVNDLRRLPVLTTLYLKEHTLSSMPGKRAQIIATSSGTNGKKTQIGFDYKGLYDGFFMVQRLTRYHGLLSPRPANYIVMGYQPSRSNKAAIAKTAFGVTLFAPALHREYALKYDKGGYRVDLDGVREALARYAKGRFPVRIIGFPAYTWFFMQRLQREGVRFRLHPDSRVLLGGGWKQFYRERVDKPEFYALMEETLGLPDSQCTEFFGAVEHPILYCHCKRHHFHVPVYSRVIIRDVRTLEPVPHGTPGLVNLITPMLESAPVVSVMTDDLGILHDGASCGCGITSPYLEVIGRVGMQGVKTCAAGADELLGGGTL